MNKEKRISDNLMVSWDEIKDVLPVSVFILSPFWVINDTNTASENLTGYKPAEIIGQPIDFILQDEIKLGSLKKKAVKLKTFFSQDLSLLSKDKKKIPVAVSISDRYDKKNNLIGYFLSILDISENKKNQIRIEKITKEMENSRRALMNIVEDVEESQKISEEEKNKTLTIISNLTDGLMVFDENNNLSLINAKIEYFFDIESKEVVNKSVLELAKYPTLEFLIGLLQKEGKGVFRKELAINENLILEISTIAISGRGKDLGMVVILHDITREKTVERMKTEFVSLAAHQLRTPLSAIKWTLKMLLDGDLGQITEEQRNFIEKTYKSNERMINLINDLLDVSRIEEGRYVQKPVLTDLENIVQFVVNTYKDESARKKINLEFQKPKNKLPKVFLDVEKIRIVIQNLVENALKYTLENGRINASMKYLEKEKVLQFQIQDNGIGIPKDQQNRIFTKFFRGANVLRMDTDGNGLGLFICKNIVEAHNGKIWFESEENKGTTFYLNLPVREEFTEFLKEF